MIKQFEGLRLKSYTDAAGVLTIGYGHTSAAGNPIVTRGLTITEAQAEKILATDLGQFEAAVERLVKVPLTDNQFSALVSFTYNVGVTSLTKSTLLKKLNKGDYEAVPSEMAKWVKAGGKRLQGLANRRMAEGNLWIKDEPPTAANVTPSASKIPLKESVEALAPILTAIPSFTDIVTGSGSIHWFLILITIVGLAMWAYFFIQRINSERP